MTNIRFYRMCFVLEVLTVLVVPLIFKFIENRTQAGFIAGSVFVFLGAFVVTGGLRGAQILRSPTFAVGCVHLFIVSLPLLITRALNYETSFEDLFILGVPGPLFHRLSTGLFVVLFVATVFDLWRAVRSKRSSRVVESV